LRHGSRRIAENVERNCFEGAREGKFKLGYISLVRYFLFTYVVMYNSRYIYIYVYICIQ